VIDGRAAGALPGRQDGRAADDRLPLTEFILDRLPGPRAAWVLAWAAVPMAAGIAPGSYLTTVGAESIAARLFTGVAFAYAVVWPSGLSPG
jgi:hypothetical protein